jgi:hypothetical protein
MYSLVPEGGMSSESVWVVQADNNRKIRTERCIIFIDIEMIIATLSLRIKEDTAIVIDL